MAERISLVADTMVRLETSGILLLAVICVDSFIGVGRKLPRESIGMAYYKPTEVIGIVPEERSHGTANGEHG